MKNLIYLLVFILYGCFTHDIVEESICVDRCIMVEGTILNSVTKEPLENVKVESSYFRPSFLISSRGVKAESVTDINGFYTMRFEVFDTEIDEGGHFDVQIDKEDDGVFWPYEEIDLLEIRNNDFNFDTVFVSDFWIPRSATVKYDMDCLSHLKDDETATFSVNYEFEEINGPISGDKALVFTSETEKDDGSLKVPAGVPLTIVATLITQSDTTELKRMITTLSEYELIEVEVGI